MNRKTLSLQAAGRDISDPGPLSASETPLSATVSDYPVILRVNSQSTMRVSLDWSCKLQMRLSLLASIYILSGAITYRNWLVCILKVCSHIVVS